MQIKKRSECSCKLKYSVKYARKLWQNVDKCCKSSNNNNNNNNEATIELRNKQILNRE